LCGSDLGVYLFKDRIIKGATNAMPEPISAKWVASVPRKRQAFGTEAAFRNDEDEINT